MGFIVRVRAGPGDARPGMHGRRLPPTMSRPNEHGVRGGVEFASAWDAGDKCRGPYVVAPEYPIARRVR